MVLVWISTITQVFSWVWEKSKICSSVIINLWVFHTKNIRIAVLFLSRLRYRSCVRCRILICNCLISSLLTIRVFMSLIIQILFVVSILWVFSLLLSLNLISSFLNYCLICFKNITLMRSKQFFRCCEIFWLKSIFFSNSWFS